MAKLYVKSLATSDISAGPLLCRNLALRASRSHPSQRFACKHHLALNSINTCQTC